MSLEDHVRSDHGHVVNLINNAFLLSQTSQLEPAATPLLTPNRLIQVNQQLSRCGDQQRIGEATSVIKR